jgi:hypothetical protein
LFIGQPCILHQKAKDGEINSVKVGFDGHISEIYSFDDQEILIAF